MPSVTLLNEAFEGFCVGGNYRLIVGLLLWSEGIKTTNVGGEAILFISH